MSEEIDKVISGESELLTVMQICDMVKIKRKTLERWRSSGYFPKEDYSLRSGPRWTEETFKAWLLKQKT